jgi:hypothetical protein
MRVPTCATALGAGVAIVAVGVASPAQATAHRGPDSSKVVYFRPVLCFAPDYNPAVPNPGPLTTASCSPASRLSATNLETAPSSSAATGFTSHAVAPDPALAGALSTDATKESGSATVLLPGYRFASTWPGASRFLLGPAEMTSRSIAKASASENQTGAWVVDYTMTKRGSILWDKVTRENFHKLLSIDFDGRVVSAPVIQPTQSHFSGFGARGEISGSVTGSEALALAKALHRP